MLTFLDVVLSKRILNSRCVFKEGSHIDLIGSLFDFPAAVVQVASKKSKSSVGLLKRSINMTWVLKLTLLSTLLERWAIFSRWVNYEQPSCWVNNINQLLLKFHSTFG